MQTRRKFVRNSLFATASFLTPELLHAGQNNVATTTKLTILHTNDMHSRIEPFPMDGSKYQGLGGVEARAAIIQQIRNVEENVLLLDAGDIFQGTPYFNFYKGEVEMKAMSAMKYDAFTIGNHDFDAGLENFLVQTKKASFPLIICNYDFRHTVMENNFLPYKIFRRGRLKIGVTGVGIELQGLVPEIFFANTKYLDPVIHANETAYKLKTEQKCDLIICLSHLGYKYRDNKVSDVVLAKNSENIDLIIGGHSHVFLDAPDVVKNKSGKEVLINQVGFAGIKLGRIDYEFFKSTSKKFIPHSPVLINEKTSE
jgi:5'-nucleotidase